jgi:hypothetical protein
MEEALDQQTILDLARRTGRKAPAEFASQISGWLSERKDNRAGAASDGIAVVQVDD